MHTVFPLKAISAVQPESHDWVGGREEEEEEDGWWRWGVSASRVDVWAFRQEVGARWVL